MKQVMPGATVGAGLPGIPPAPVYHSWPASPHISIMAGPGRQKYTWLLFAQVVSLQSRDAAGRPAYKTLRRGHSNICSAVAFRPHRCAAASMELPAAVFLLLCVLYPWRPYMGLQHTALTRLTPSLCPRLAPWQTGRGRCCQGGWTLLWCGGTSAG